MVRHAGPKDRDDMGVNGLISKNSSNLHLNMQPGYLILLCVNQ
jgi:hypothetical protein